MLQVYDVVMVFAHLGCDRHISVLFLSAEMSVTSVGAMKVSSCRGKRINFAVMNSVTHTSVSSIVYMQFMIQVMSASPENCVPTGIALPFR